MPLLNSKAWFPEGQEPEVPPEAKVYHVRQTGEVFATYEEYISRIILLTSRQWQSTNGKTGLTYEQAVREDELAPHLLETFPKELEEAAVKTAHHSLLPLEELVNVIHSSHCSPSVSGKENLPGQNGGPPQACCSSAVAHDSIRCWLMTATRKEDHGKMSLWVAKQEYQQRYKLAEHVSQELANELAEAAKAAKAQEEAGPKSPSKSTSQGPKKRKSDGATQVEKGAKQATAAKTETKQKKVERAEGNQPEEHWEPPPLRSIEEEEERLKPGAHKSILFLILKEAGADGMNVQQMVGAAKQRGLKEYDGSNRRVLSETLRTDPAFVRVAKGVYALRALMGARPYEAVGRPKKKLPKAQGLQPAGAAEQAGPSTEKEGSKKARPDQPSSPETKKRKKAGAAGPAVGSPAKKAKRTEQAEREKQPEEQDRLPPVRTIEEEEKHMKPGSNKEVAFRVLQEAGPAGLTIQQIMEAAKQKKLKDFTDIPRGSLSSTLTTDPAFVRVIKGVYALRTLMGESPYEAVGRPKKKKPRADKPGAEADGALEGTAGASTEQIANDQEVESKTQGEQIQNEVRRALDAHRQALAKAQTAEQRAQARMDKATQDPRTPSKKVHEDALGAMPSFELTEEQKAFRGSPDHRKDAAAHRKRIANLVAEQKAAKNEWLARLAEAREKDAKASGHQDIAKVQRGLKSAQKKVALARSELASAEQALKDAAKAVHKEKAKKAADEKRAEERRLREEAKVQERERKKAEALEAKRYPMEDLQLLEEQQARAAAAGLPLPAEDLPLPSEWLSEQDSAATSGLLYVVDLLAQFPQVFKVRSVPRKEMLALLEGACSARGNERPADSLWDLYHDLLTLALQESEQDSSERAWLALLNKGTLAEVLHRYLDSRQRVIGERCAPGVSEAASALAAANLDSLTSHQHLAVLSFLCDDVLDGEAMRDALQERLDHSDDVKREMREAVAEKKGTLKEILESEKEEKRRKREEEKAAKKAKEEAQKAQEEAAASNHAGQEAGLPQAAAAEGLPEPAREGANAPDDEEEEPSWSLPAELQEFQGDPTDRKGMLTFRQRQQAARKGLEKAKERWQAAARQRAKEREARQRATAEAERAKAKAKTAAEEELVREQEAYERELEKFSIRRAPLGLDRRHRQYWWGLAGQRGHIYVEDDQGRWAVLRAKEELDALMAALDARGLREGGLHSALEKAYSSIIKAMKAAQLEPGKSRAGPAVAATDRFPKRERAQPVVLNPSWEAGSEKQAANKPSAQMVLEGLAGAGLEATVGTLTRLQREMAAWGVPPPEEGWKAWSVRYKNAATDADAAPGEEGSLNDVLATLKTCLVDAEGLLEQAAQLASEAPSEPPNAATRASSDDSDGGDGNHRKLWSSDNEQTHWRFDVVEGKTLAAIAFTTAQLETRSKQLLQGLKPALHPKPAAMAAPGVGPKKAAKAALEADACLPAAQAVGPDSDKNGTAASKAGRTRATVNDVAHEGRLPAKAAPLTKSNNNAKHATRAVASAAAKAATNNVAPKAALRAKPVAAPKVNAQPKAAAIRNGKRKAESFAPPRVTRSKAT